MLIVDSNACGLLFSSGYPQLRVDDTGNDPAESSGPAKSDPNWSMWNTELASKVLRMFPSEQASQDITGFRRVHIPEGLMRFTRAPIAPGSQLHYGYFLPPQQRLFQKYPVSASVQVLAGVAESGQKGTNTELCGATTEDTLKNEGEEDPFYEASGRAK